VNLGLCYLKTGQMHLARDVLEEVIQRVPDHLARLGLFGAHLRAAGASWPRPEAGVREGRAAHLARRMQRLLAEQSQSQQEPLDTGSVSASKCAWPRPTRCRSWTAGKAAFPAPRGKTSPTRRALAVGARSSSVTLRAAAAETTPAPRWSDGSARRCRRLPTTRAARDSVPPRLAAHPPPRCARRCHVGALALEVARVSGAARQGADHRRAIGTCVTSEGLAARSDVLSSWSSAASAVAQRR
jgi:hypothetical protein